jgi:hypothetical protein
MQLREKGPAQHASNVDLTALRGIDWHQPVFASGLRDQHKGFPNAGACRRREVLSLRAACGMVCRDFKQCNFFKWRQFMKSMLDKRRLVVMMGLAGAVGVLASCSQMGGSMGSMMGGGQQVTLSGSNEVPPVTTGATGSGTVTVKSDRSVSANITVLGMTATAAHIHEGAAGANGPVIVPFTKTSDNTFAAAEGAKMTESQYAAYKAGNTYVNVHSAKNPGGEIRVQLKGN